VRVALGVVPEDLFFSVTELVLHNRPAQVFALVEELDQKGHSPREFLRGLCDHFMNYLKAKDHNAAALIEASDAVRQQYLQQTQYLDENDILRILAILQEAFTDIRRHPQPRMKLELTLLRLASLERTAKIEELLAELRGAPPPPRKASAPPPQASAASPPQVAPPAKPEAVTQPPVASPTPEPAPAPAPVSARPAPQDTPVYEPARPPEPPAAPPKPKADSQITWDLTAVQAEWAHIADFIADKKLGVAGQLKLGNVEKLEEDAIVAAFGLDLADMQLDSLRKQIAAGVFDDGLEALFGRPVRLAGRTEADLLARQGLVGLAQPPSRLANEAAGRRLTHGSLPHPVLVVRPR